MVLRINEIKQILFYSILQSLAEKESDLSDSEIKTILYDALDRIPDFKIKWGKHSRFGKNRILILHQNRLAILDMNLLIHFTKDVWSHYLEQKKSPLKGAF